VEKLVKIVKATQVHMVKTYHKKLDRNTSEAGISKIEGRFDVRLGMRAVASVGRESSSELLDHPAAVSEETNS
jgi:hypothetical protein